VAIVADEKTNGSRNESGSHREDLVLVLDFGGQTAQLIARRIRDANVFCQLVRHDLSSQRICELNPRGLILSGGPASVYETKAPELTRRFSSLAFRFWGSVMGCSRFAALSGAA